MNMTTKLMLVMHCEDVSGISFMAGEQHSGGRGGQFIITRPLFWPCIGKRWNIEIKSKSCRFGGGNNVNITATVRCIWRVSRYLSYRGTRMKKLLLLQLELKSLGSYTNRVHSVTLLIAVCWSWKGPGWHGMEEKVADQRPFPSHLPPLPLLCTCIHSI